MHLEPDPRTTALVRSLYLLRKRSFQDVYPELSNGEFFALFSLFALKQETGEEMVRISELGKRLKLTPQAVSKTLRALEKKGFAQRHTDPNDRRSTLVQVTEQGEFLLWEAREVITDFSRRVTQRMGEGDMAEFLRLSQKCSALMDEVAEEMRLEREEDAS